MSWILAACASALFAGVTSVLSKCGIKRTHPDLAMAIRTAVVLLMVWPMVFFGGSFPALRQISPMTFLFLILSGLATGISWIFQFKALAIGEVSLVDPINKTSTVMTVLFALIFFGETESLTAKLIGVLGLSLGCLLMMKKSDQSSAENSKTCILYAFLSAVFAALTSIFAKIGIDGVDSNVANAIRSTVIFLIAWGIWLPKKKKLPIGKVSKRELNFILLSGITTGLSWFFYYYAIQFGLVSIVVPIDKMSLVLAVLFSVIFLKEKQSRNNVWGLVMMTFGTLVMAIFQ
jgi:transporter family protein